MEANDTVMTYAQCIAATLPVRPPLTDVERIAKAQDDRTRNATLQEVGEAICCLVGNLMLEDMEKGKLLGEQLRPILALCKGEKPE